MLTFFSVYIDKKPENYTFFYKKSKGKNNSNNMEPNQPCTDVQG